MKRDALQAIWLVSKKYDATPRESYQPGFSTMKDLSCPSEFLQAPRPMESVVKWSSRRSTLLRRHRYYEGSGGEQYARLFRLRSDQAYDRTVAARSNRRNQAFNLKG